MKIISFLHVLTKKILNPLYHNPNLLTQIKIYQSTLYPTNITPSTQTPWCNKHSSRLLFEFNPREALAHCHKVSHNSLWNVTYPITSHYMTLLICPPPNPRQLRPVNGPHTAHSDAPSVIFCKTDDLLCTVPRE